AQPRRASIVSFARQRVELTIEIRVARLPDRRRRDRGNADRHQGRDQPAADLAAIEPDDGIDSPDFQHADEAHEADHQRDDPAEQWQIAVGASLEAREALQYLRLDPEAAVDQAQGDDDGKARHQHHGNGADEILQEQRIAVADVERPYGPEREIERDRQIMPEPGGTIAHSRGKTGTVRGRADEVGDGPTALQDDDDDEEMHDQHHQTNDRQVAATMQPEQQRDIRKGNAGNRDGNDATGPDFDIGRGLGAHLEQAEGTRERPHRTDEHP